MVIRNRYIAFFYRLVVLAFAILSLILLVIDGHLDDNYSISWLYFGTEVVFISCLTLLAEVIANGIGLKEGANGMAPGVWSPLALAIIFYNLADVVTYFATSPFFYGSWAKSTSSLFVVAITKIVFPALLLIDYWLFGEKGTVKWKHATYWLIYPFFYFWLLMATNYMWGYDWFAYPYFNIQNFATSSLPWFAASQGWGGVWAMAGILAAGYALLAYLVIFVNFCFAGAFKVRSPESIR